MSWKTEQEEEKLRHYSQGVIHEQTGAGSAFSPCPQLPAGVCFPHTASILYGDGATLSLG